MRLFARHIKSTIFLGIYALWWTIFFYWFTSGAAEYPNSCGAANGALVMLTLLIAGVCSLTLLILGLTNKGQKRIDYLIFLGLVLSPLFYIIAYIFIAS